METGQSTVVIPNFQGTYGTNISGLDVDPTTGLLYASTVSSCAGGQSQLYSVDLDGGTASLIGNTAGACVISVVIGPTGDAFAIDIISNAIIPISLIDGQFTGPAMPLGVDLNFGQDYSFDCPSDDNMVFGYAFNNSTFTMQYVSIDPTTGTLTLIQDLGFDQIGSFAFCPSDPIPTVGEWGLIILGMSFLIVGVVALREKSIKIIPA